MKYSFIIPAYQCVDTLRYMVSCLSDTKLEQKEILIVDDGSNDGTFELCDELALQIPCVRVFHQSNRGVSAARNRGLDEAKGKYVIFCDADDWVEPKGMCSMLQLMEAGPAVELAVSGLSFDYYRKNGVCYKQTTILPPFSGIVEQAVWQNAILRLQAANSLSSLCGKVFLRSILTEHSLRLREEMTVYEDLEFSLRYLSYCRRILFVQDPIYHYRQSTDEGNAGRRLKRITSISSVVSAIERALSTVPGQPDQSGERLLAELYLVLARIKISVSSPRTIRTTCRDFRSWISERPIEFPSLFPGTYTNMKNNRVLLLYCRSRRYKLRHWLANLYKDLRRRMNASRA